MAVCVGVGGWGVIKKTNLTQLQARPLSARISGLRAHLRHATCHCSGRGSTTGGGVWKRTRTRRSWAMSPRVSSGSSWPILSKCADQMILSREHIMNQWSRPLCWIWFKAMQHLSHWESQSWHCSSGTMQVFDFNKVEKKVKNWTRYRNKPEWDQEVFQVAAR